MDMNNWFEALVIILSIMLALFLLLGIVILVKFLQMLRQIKRITDHAEEVVDKAEYIADFFKHSSGPMAVIKIIGNISESFQSAAEKFSGKSKKKRGKKNDKEK
ncbi:hypothetical protein KY385_04180 [Candidatus Parcubacteria bacterium]|nr:hypothetical protein [Candidatus Parcubacteria bacterium]